MRLLTYDGLSLAGFEAPMARLERALAENDFRAAGLKKLEGGYYRARLSDSARLILQFVNTGAERAALALELLPHHEYDRSRFLRGVSEVDEGRIDAPVEPPAESPMRYLHPTRTTFALLDKPLSFDDAQASVLDHRAPLVLVGSAGSGKTALLLSHLRRVAGRVAYVTESGWLAQSARGLYFAHAWDPGEQEADFLSFRQFLDSIEVPRGRPVTFRDFRAFFERHRARLRFTDAHRVFEELRGVITAEPAAPLSLEQYLALGVKQSLYSDEERRIVFELFLRYREFLSDGGLFEPNLVAHALATKVAPRYDFLAIDEVQDLTPAQLQLILRSLTTPGQFILAGDANQVVHPNFFSWAKVRSLFWTGLGAEPTSTTAAVLRVSYRNAAEVTRVANAVLAIKHARFGSIDRESNVLLEAVAGAAGEVRGLTTGTPAVRDLDTKTRRSTEVAVVVLREEDKADARQQFGTPLVFSVLESKGLEYDNVILYRLLSSERRVYAELAEGLDRSDVDVQALDYARAKDKRDKTSEAYKFFVNALYVALTRARLNAWLIEDDASHPLLNLLRVPFDGAPALGQVKQASVEDWQREASRLEAQGKLEQAEAIVSQVLRLSPTPWKALDEAGAIELIGRALDPAGVSRKAREQLLDFEALHPNWHTQWELESVGFRKRTDQKAQRAANRARLLQDFSSKKLRVVLDQTDKYGVEYRTMQGLTPLMAAAHAGNLELVDGLLARGASRTARDPHGLQAMHHALRAAENDEAFAKTRLAAMWDRLAPESFDVKVGDRLVQIGREQGEYIVFQLMLLRLWMSECTRSGVMVGIGTTHLLGLLDRLPENVIRDFRRKRQYLSSMLSKNESGSTSPYSRRLFLRRRHGHYVFNPDLSVWSPAGGDGGAWVPVEQMVGLKLRVAPAAFYAATIDRMVKQGIDW